MDYPCELCKAVIISEPLKTVKHVCTNKTGRIGTFDSTETGNDETNALVQIKIRRIFGKDTLTTTITRATAAELAEYLDEVKKNNEIKPIDPNT